MTGDQQRGRNAEAMLTLRLLCRRLFPSDIFDEYAWNMLLCLFVGLVSNEIISERMLIERSDVSLAVGRRWIAHLMHDGQISARADGDDVVLSTNAVENLRSFLDKARLIELHANQIPSAN